MKTIESLLAIPPYSMKQTDKEQELLPVLNALQNHHYRSCVPYRKIIDIIYHGNHTLKHIENCPYLPVNIFKELELASVPKNEFFKVLLSSGTTSGQPSKIILDTTTAHRQTAALASIMESLIGPKRLPMLIIDNPHTISDPKQFSARSAGIIGMSHFGREHCYALDDLMELDSARVDAWLKKHSHGPFLIFGFTYIIWKYFLMTAKSRSFNLSNAILFHSGGWKKLETEMVTNATFKEKLRKNFDLSRCHSFYGMVEQAGSIFVECEHGCLHCPNFAEVIIRDPRTWTPSTKNSQGIIQVISLLPTSYPGHSLLTEDLGKIIGIDDCVCGRKGKTFWVDGRAPQAVSRGCGDTFAIHTHNEDGYVP